jgi:voltage-gated potassium channel
MSNNPNDSSWRSQLYEIIFDAETPAGRTFDVILLWAILISVAAVLLESIESFSAAYGFELKVVEWIFTILFTLEYLVRIICVKYPKKYIFSFFGLVDLLAILPGYLSLVFVGSHSLLVIRGLRLLRIFRIFKLGRYTGEAGTLLKALDASRAKITVFLGTVVTIVLIMGAVMYLVEGADSGFTSIPRAIYWAIVTMTTVGYGDLVPATSLGQFIASMIMICGYGIIAVPTGIVSVELANAQRMDLRAVSCPNCKKKEHPLEANFCMNCGEKL